MAKNVGKWAAGAAAVGAGALALRDLTQTKHSILRNYPLIGHMRYLMEDARPMIQQYFIEPDFDGRPFDRTTRSMIYDRAKDQRSLSSFGSKLTMDKPGHETLIHSSAPKEASDVLPTVRVGGPNCTKPYDLSLMNISAMSFGSLSANAVLAMNKGAAMGGFAQDTGEGGMTDYHERHNADLVWELGGGYFSARTPEGMLDREKFKEIASRDQVKMIAIKLSQGAKPGVGGVLPKEKLTEEVARFRGVPRDEDCVSPAAHPEFSTPREMMRFIAELRELSGGKPIGIKLCVGSRADVLAIAKAMLEEGTGPDFINVDGSEGGTGAASREFSDWVGMPLTDGLMAVHNALVGTGLRDEVVVSAAGKIAGGTDIVKRLIQGADVTYSARAMMMAVGCIQAQICHTDKCPVGVTTQDDRRQRALNVENKAERVYNYQRRTVNEAQKLMGAMGVTDPADLRKDMLRKRISPSESQTYAELYHWLEPGELLDAVPDDWARDWQLASADHFGPATSD